MKKLVIFYLFLCFTFNTFSQEKRDLFQKEGNQIGIANTLIKDFADIGFPNYNDRNFWNNLPSNLKKQYIQDAEESLDYNWPVVKATDYL